MKFSFRKLNKHNIIFVLLLLIIIGIALAYFFKKYQEKRHIEKLKKQIIGAVKPSKVHGVGVFALRNINKNEEFFKNVDKQEFLVKEKELEKNLPEYQIDYIEKIHNYEKGYSLMINNINLIPITSFLNHSKNPNVKWYEKNNCYKSLKFIKKDEELLIDYKIDNKTLPRIPKHLR